MSSHIIRLLFALFGRQGVSWPDFNTHDSSDSSCRPRLRTLFPMLLSSPTVLITEASSNLASHIIDEFLARGYFVLGALCSEALIEQVRKDHQHYPYEQLNICIVRDITKPNAFDEAVKEVNGVIHTSSPVFYDSEAFDENLLEGIVKGTRGLLESILRNGTNVTSVVITGSLSSVINTSKGLNPGVVYSETDWNPIDIETSMGDPQNLDPLSKTMAEQAAWMWYRSSDPPWKMSTICPPVIYGPLSPSASLVNLERSTLEIWHLMSGEANELPPTAMPAFVDVRDAAKAHLKAFEHPTGGRFIPCGGSYLFADISHILQRHFPEYSGKIPSPSLADVNIETYQVDNNWTLQELNMRFRGLEDCIVDTGRALIELDRREDHDL
jgi:nucleoside-diphosphate-sugar epimerase